MRRSIALLAALMLCICGAYAADAPELAGQEAVLYCAENGQVLFGKEMDKPAPPASVTKLMTALLVLESGIDLDQTVTVSHDAVYTIERGSTHIALDEGEEVALRPMLYAMLLTSANDAANVLAEAVDGTQAEFAAHMNARAEELGCRHTHFVNAHGLDDPQHYTTAYDLARITRALLDYDEFLTVCGTQVYRMPPTNKQAEEREFWNKQNILNPQSKFYDASAIAGKNGYTSQAGHTLVTVARRDGVTLIAVTLGSTESKYDKHRDTAALFDYGYQFTKTTLSTAELAAAARQAGLSPDEAALEPVTVLLPAGKTTGDLQFSAENGMLCATFGAGDRLTLEIPVSAAVQQEPAGDNATPPDRTEAQPDTGRKPGGVPDAVKYAAFAAAGLLAAFLILLSYRTARIRRQRKRIREMRMRQRREKRE